MTGMLAVSKAGHDKNRVYVIIKEENEYVYLADGRNRTVYHPKKKKIRHVQLIKRMKMEMPPGGYQDLEVKRIIKKYQEDTNVKG